MAGGCVLDTRAPTSTVRGQWVLGRGREERICAVAGVATACSHNLASHKDHRELYWRVWGQIGVRGGRGGTMPGVDCYVGCGARSCLLWLHSEERSVTRPCPSNPLPSPFPPPPPGRTGKGGSRHTRPVPYPIAGCILVPQPTKAPNPTRLRWQCAILGLRTVSFRAGQELSA